jgi:hypothetical protein
LRSWIVDDFTCKLCWLRGRRLGAGPLIRNRPWLLARRSELLGDAMTWYIADIPDKGRARTGQVLSGTRKHRSNRRLEVVASRDILRPDG